MDNLKIKIGDIIKTHVLQIDIVSSILVMDSWAYARSIPISLKNLFVIH